MFTLATGALARTPPSGRIRINLFLNRFMNRWRFVHHPRSSIFSLLCPLMESIFSQSRTNERTKNSEINLLIENSFLGNCRLISTDLFGKLQLFLSLPIPFVDKFFKPRWRFLSAQIYQKVSFDCKSFFIVFLNIKATIFSKYLICKNI